jgi:hypothetical protein
MKILSLALLLMATLTFVLMGCSDSPGPNVAPPSSGDNNPTSLMKASDGPGAWIIRDRNETYRMWFRDPEAGLILVVGINDYADFCATRMDGMDGVDVRQLFLPNADPEARRKLQQVKARDFSAQIWALSQWAGNPCAAWNSIYPPMATGTVNYITTDNDALANTQDNPNRRTFGYKATGTLYGPDGQVFHLNFVSRIVYDPHGTFFNQAAKIQLTPTGN